MTETKTATLSFNNKMTEFPVYQPTLGFPVIDISALGKSGAYTYDSGFMSTAACESKITFIDGGKGVLLYRGYPIGELAEHSDYLEVCYLLLQGELPDAKQKTTFLKAINERMAVESQVEAVFKAFKKDAHPMAILISAMGALAGQYHEKFDITNAEHRDEIALLLIAKIPTLVAMCYRHGQGKSFLAPRKDLSYTENFIHMMFSKSADEKPCTQLSHAMNILFMLHADHEQNASTSTVRLSGSTGTDAFAAIASGIAALWGPAHGGANEAALNMLKEIGNVSAIPDYVTKFKDKSSGVRLMGFGHRVYKNYDPRATVMQKICHDVLELKGAKENEIFKVAVELEKIALNDKYFVERKLYPNVDFYSGITQSAMGIPSNLFTAIFTLGRTVGWIAHWNEMLSNPYKIGRPRQLYTGYAERGYPKK